MGKNSAKKKGAGLAKPNKRKKTQEEVKVAALCAKVEMRHWGSACKDAEETYFTGKIHHSNGPICSTFMAVNSLLPKPDITCSQAAVYHRHTPLQTLVGPLVLVWLLDTNWGRFSYRQPDFSFPPGLRYPISPYYLGYVSILP
ncbi:hypothetical protein OBBRIDRAFT_807463 [Obba rivulosa]|uniref:Uncharacterized protein n=1 Tax=Obba rivulosa TaxID=1052685 RepID=A0A8E2DK79_9APHY|nr:hypothetical protein OBBRIDRAFT_807463 [Obba rivulosa]